MNWRCFIERLAFCANVLDIMYHLPERSNVASCTITRDVILKNGEPLYRFEQRKQSA